MIIAALSDITTYSYYLFTQTVPATRPVRVTPQSFAFAFLTQTTIRTDSDLIFSQYLSFLRIVVWRAKTLSFQTSPFLTSNVWWLPPGRLRWHEPRGCFYWSVYWFVWVVFGFFHLGSPLFFQEILKKKSSFKFFYSLSSLFPFLSSTRSPNAFWTPGFPLPAAPLPLPHTQTPSPPSLFLPPCRCCA